MTGALTTDPLSSRDVHVTGRTELPTAVVETDEVVARPTDATGATTVSEDGLLATGLTTCGAE